MCDILQDIYYKAHGVLSLFGRCCYESVYDIFVYHDLTSFMWKWSNCLSACFYVTCYYPFCYCVMSCYKTFDTTNAVPAMNDRDITYDDTTDIDMSDDDTTVDLCCDIPDDMSDDTVTY